MTIVSPRLAWMLGANLVLLVAAPALAADASAWDGDQRSAIRLITGTSRNEGGATIHRAGIEIRLARGWKTYWRYPGDSGVPPRFDFSKSSNVKSVSVRWPAPERLTDEGGTSIGYKHDVTFPLDVVPQDAGRPVALSLSIEYAVCEKLCVPAEGRADVTITGKLGKLDVTLAADEARVPKPAAVGANGVVSVRAVKRDGARVTVDVAYPANTAVDLFAEGPEPDWALPVPSPVAGAPAGQQRFAFQLDGLPSGATADGTTLKLTAVAGDQAIEVPYRLDSAN
jgi:DsbC/DsbD-like thiol-disulfide interchange protein